MKTTKIITIITSLLVLVTITAVGLFGGNTNILIAPGLAVVVALFGAKHIFEDPEATAKLKDEHADAIRKMKADHSNVIDEITKAETEREAHVENVAMKVHADYRETIAQKDAVIAALKLKLAEEHKRLTDAWAKIPPANTNPMSFMIASGGAKTHRPPQ